MTIMGPDPGLFLLVKRQELKELYNSNQQTYNRTKYNFGHRINTDVAKFIVATTDQTGSG